MKHEIINADCFSYLARTPCSRWGTIFADPPDNIGLKYETHHDKMSDSDYGKFLSRCLYNFTAVADTVWFSFNARHILKVCEIAHWLARPYRHIEAKLCVQTFTFGQHNHHDLGNNFRPLLRMRRKDAPLFPDAIRVESDRQKQGDKRADPRGRVPGDVFDFPRVVGNSKQRRKWHPTQLHEGLVERCLKLTTPPGGTVLDPFAGTGTTLRVCKRLGLGCTAIEVDPNYCRMIAAENEVEVK